MKKILIVDDSQTIAHTLRKVLTEKGYNVSIAFDGMQGVMFAHRNEPDLIILDYKMPAGDGASVADKIRLSVKTQHIPIIVFSAEDMEKIKPKLQATGISNVIQKPRVEELILKVKEILGE